MTIDDDGPPAADAETILDGPEWPKLLGHGHVQGICTDRIAAALGISDATNFTAITVELVSNETVRLLLDGAQRHHGLSGSGAVNDDVRLLDLLELHPDPVQAMAHVHLGLGSRLLTLISALFSPAPSRRPLTTSSCAPTGCGAASPPRVYSSSNPELSWGSGGLPPAP